jgi:hypothetical protein
MIIFKGCINRGAPLEGGACGGKRDEAERPEGYPLNLPFSLHYVTSLTWIMIGDKDIFKKLIILQNIVNVPGTFV